MSDSEITSLEVQIENFINAYNQALNENLALRKKIANLSQEYAILLDKKKKTSLLLKNIITELKEKLLCHKKQTQ
jgi:hypothetical protein